MHGMLYEGIVRRGLIRVHAPLIKRPNGTYVNLNTGLIEDVLSSEVMAKDRINYLFVKGDK